MARYAQELRAAVRDEVGAMKARSADAAVIRSRQALGCTGMPTRCQRRPCRNWCWHGPRRRCCDKMVIMREELRQMWLHRSRSREQLAADLQAWCHRAEASGIAVLQEFSLKLRSARA